MHRAIFCKKVKILAIFLRSFRKIYYFCTTNRYKIIYNIKISKKEKKWLK